MAMPLRTAPRITAFSPGQSPPLVRIPIFIFLAQILVRRFYGQSATLSSIRDSSGECGVGHKRLHRRGVRTPAQDAWAGMVHDSTVPPFGGNGGTVWMDDGGCPPTGSTGLCRASRGRT